MPKVEVMFSEKKERWEVLDDGICYDDFETKAEASSIADKLHKSYSFMDELRVLAFELVQDWTEEERNFLGEHWGNQIVEVLQI